MAWHAPWCYHCQRLEPKYQKVADEFANDDSLLIAQFNIDKNDMPLGWSVQAMPKVMWMPKGKEAELYMQPRDTVAMREFLGQKHKRVPWPAKDEF